MNRNLLLVVFLAAPVLAAAQTADGVDAAQAAVGSMQALKSVRQIPATAAGEESAPIYQDTLDDIVYRTISKSGYSAVWPKEGLLLILNSVPSDKLENRLEMDFRAVLRIEKPLEWFDYLSYASLLPRDGLYPLVGSSMVNLAQTPFVIFEQELIYKPLLPGSVAGDNWRGAIVSKRAIIAAAKKAAIRIQNEKAARQLTKK